MGNTTINLTFNALNAANFTGAVEMRNKVDICGTLSSANINSSGSITANNIGTETTIGKFNNTNIYGDLDVVGDAC